MWRIDKQFSFCYGHRVWSQELHSDYCENFDDQCKCRHLHGHEGLVHIFLEGENLTKGMVTDFKHLGWLKTFLDDTLDHKFIIDRHDPIFQKIMNIAHPINSTSQSLVTVDDHQLFFQNITIPGSHDVVACRLNTDTLDSPLEQEFYQSFVIVDFVPTSENLSKWIFDIANVRMEKLGIKVSQVDWFETPKSRSTYYRPN